jgi:isobutyryl-CoA mutase
LIFQRAGGIFIAHFDFELMKQISKSPQTELNQTPYSPQHRTRFVTAASLFDGHDASINIMRRILQSTGVEVIHLGHNRSAREIVAAALQEDAQGIAVSSYQGGHTEFFKYIIDLLKEAKAPHIKVFGGGGGTITNAEIEELEAYGVSKLFSAEEGRKLGLQGMINKMVVMAEAHPASNIEWLNLPQYKTNPKALAQVLTCAEIEESFWDTDSQLVSHKSEWKDLTSSMIPVKKGRVIGITGTGGAGKSSFTDEIVIRILEREKESRIAILAIDPTRKKTGGALLGDRLRVNALKNPRCYMRSYATREANVSISNATKKAVGILKASGFDWIFVETGGIGQADTSIVDLVDTNIYVMTSEFGAPTQLEKINMLDYADLVIINKFDKGGSLDALTEVRKQFRRNHREFESVPANQYPIFGTISSRFADPGVDAAFEHLYSLAPNTKQLMNTKKGFEPGNPFSFAIVPKDRSNYLSEISTTVREYHAHVMREAESFAKIEAFERTLEEGLSETAKREIKLCLEERKRSLDPDISNLVDTFEDLKRRYREDTFTYTVRSKEISVPLFHESLSHNKIPKVAVPAFLSKADQAKFVGLENLPGYFPYTAGVFPFKRSEEDPKRQFAGEGTPQRTNKRFHLLCQGEKAKRLSTAFDSVTLYGHDPDERPDIYGKIGESGVSVCSLEDAKKLYAGFDLCDPNTSVSMTINGPAPMLLAFFFNVAIDQQTDRFREANKREPSTAEMEKIRESTLQTVRGTVQADILKEDQAQNTCIFSTEFALRLMGDIQRYFIDHKIRNYYSVSVSGYHIAEAGANPISQLAFTLANGFTYVEYYRSRGMELDDFAPNFSFFFCNGLDPEYTVIGRVARRIWSVAMKHRYRANDRSQKLKYHVQTSGRSLHAQELSFNDIRTTLQALLAYFDHCNSLHTNAYDEAVTTPTEESVRRAMAIQLILSKEFGWAKNENPAQGAYFVEELTDLVEEAVLAEFDRISARGGVLGAMETQYQRSRIQEESLYYERLKHSGGLPLIGVNTFLNPHGDRSLDNINANQLTRASYAEKTEQIENLRTFQNSNAGRSEAAIEDLKSTARQGGNIFETLMRAARHCSLGQMTKAFYEIGGEYRRGV